MSYVYLRVRLPGAEQTSWLETLDRDQIWGVFFGLFGMRNDERIIVTHDADLDTAQVEVLEQFTMTATARPEKFAALDREGIYVNRTFNVLEQHVNEFVNLSKGAWQTFETDEEFSAYPFGLFRPDKEIDGLVPLQLFTWYESLHAWERSRNPDEAASANFARRRELTVTSSAIATRLVAL